MTIEQTFSNIAKILNPTIIFDDPLPCPFCGNIPLVVEHELEYGCCSTEYKNIIECETCSTNMDPDDYIQDHYERSDSKEDRHEKRIKLLRSLALQKQTLILKWNKRT